MTRRPLAVVLLALALTACAPARQVPAPTPTAAPTPEAEDAPLLDLTALSDTILFAELAAMTRSPEEYLGRQVRMQGQLAVYRANPALGIDCFYAVVVQDATACCQQGLEFVWEGDLPEEGTELLVTGRYEAYDFGGLPSYHLVAESVEVPS